MAERERAMNVNVTPADCRAAVETGIDILAAERFARLRGKRIGLVTNHTGLDCAGRATADLLHDAPGLALAALFGPEHGIRGEHDELIGDSRDPRTGLPVYSLYGSRQKPSAEQLAGLDTLVFDIQDIGCRFYTYISTLGNVMEAAQDFGIDVVVLDRPNPIRGDMIEGPLPDTGSLSFTAFHSIPVRHGMTIGELATMFAAERFPDVSLSVVPCRGWDRAMWFDATGLTWTNPSPNMRSLTQATLYPGAGLLEMTNLSVGRGTDTPFELIGAPGIDPQPLAAALRALGTPGVAAIPTYFTPRASKFERQRCGGLQLLVTDRAQFRPVRFGLALAIALLQHYGGWETDRLNALLANEQVANAILDRADAAEPDERFAAAEQEFELRRRPYLLY